MKDIDGPIRTQADLERVWRALMEPLGFSDGSFWLMAIGPDDRPLKNLTQIQDDEHVPSPDDLVQLGRVLAEIGDDLEPGSRWAVLRSRPGHGSIRPDDRALLRAVVEGCRAARVAIDVPHLATDTELLPVTPDDLAA